jgi:hypothetical protein
MNHPRNSIATVLRTVLATCACATLIPERAFAQQGTAPGLGTVAKNPVSLLPTGSSLTISYPGGDPTSREFGDGLDFYASGLLDLGTQTMPIAFPGKIFVPPNYASLMPMPLIVIGQGNHGTLRDAAWYVWKLESNGLEGCAFVMPALTHGTNPGLPSGNPGACDENAWRMLIGAMAVFQFPGVVDPHRVLGFGYSLGAAANIATLGMAARHDAFKIFRGGASMAAGVWEGNNAWPQPSTVEGILAPHVLVIGTLDQYINHNQAAAVTNSLLRRNIPAVLKEYPGIDHFALPALNQSWYDMATSLRLLMQ